MSRTIIALDFSSREEVISFLKQFDEHPSWEDDRLPGEFTAIAIKE